jgi:hypothetical protein
MTQEIPVTGETDLAILLSSMAPELMAGEFVFCTVQSAHYGDYARLAPLACFSEADGLTLVLPQGNADQAGFSYESVFSCITLTVHSSLDAVGLTAAVATTLAQRGISANVIAAYYHDHLLVPSGQAGAAMAALQALAANHTLSGSQS